MEETVQVLLDEGALMRDGAMVRLTKPLSELKISPTVQAILAARIDRLPADEKDLLQALAVMGQEFQLAPVPAPTDTPGVFWSSRASRYAAKVNPSYPFAAIS